MGTEGTAAGAVVGRFKGRRRDANFGRHHVQGMLKSTPGGQGVHYTRHSGLGYHGWGSGWGGERRGKTKDDRRPADQMIFSFKLDSL